MDLRRVSIVLSLIAMALSLLGCSTDCRFTKMSVSPPSATITVGNSQQFVAFGSVPNGCAATAANLTNVAWTTSDTINVSVTNTGGTASMKCLGTTQGPVTVTATLPASGNKGHSVSA